VPPRAPVFIYVFLFNVEF